MNLIKVFSSCSKVRQEKIGKEDGYTRTEGHSKLLPEGYDTQIHIAISILAVYGTLMIGSASMGLSVGNNQYLLTNVVKQLLFAATGYIAMCWLANHFKLSFLKSRQFLYIIFATILSLLACLGFGAVGGAKAWIRIPLSFTEMSLQPSEFAKITVILIVAAYCGDIRQTFKSGWEMIRRPVIMIVIICAIVLILQGDFGSMAVIVTVAFQCFLIPSHKQMKKYQTAGVIIFTVVLAGLLYVLSPLGEGTIKAMSFLQEYQRNRFLSVIDPFYDRYNTGFQLIRGLTSFATGGWFGVGFGHSVNKYTQFPAANTDYILAILVEELGFIGFMGLMILYGVIIVRCTMYALKIRNESARGILIGTSSYLLVHMLFNIGGVTGLIPLTGVPLLMISAGGSSTMSFMMMIGISQAVISGFNRNEYK